MISSFQTGRSNSVDPDQTAAFIDPEGAVWSGSTLFAIAKDSLQC